MAESIDDLTRRIQELKEALSEARREQAPEPIADHELRGEDGAPVRLSELFGDRDDLLLIHNMGTGCDYCTMWADGLNGMLPYLEDRSSVVLVSPDEPATQRAFADERGWRFRLASAAGTSFIDDLGFEVDGGAQPGVSALHRQPDGAIVRTGRDVFGPGDDYCPPWRLFDLLHGGPGDWGPARQR